MRRRKRRGRRVSSFLSAQRADPRAWLPKPPGLAQNDGSAMNVEKTELALRGERVVRHKGGAALEKGVQAQEKRFAGANLAEWGKLRRALEWNCPSRTLRRRH